MGISPSHPKAKGRQSTKNVTQLIDINIYNDEYAEEEYTETTECCGMHFTKTLKRKVIWENNFITHCSSIREEFRWANELIDLVAASRQPKTIFFRQINGLKMELASTPDTDREVLISPSEVEQFKNNLKRSVLVSYSQAKHQSSHRMASTLSMSARQNRIEIARFKDSSSRGSTNKKLERSPSFSSSKSGLRKSIMSFVDDTLSSVFGNEREVSKQTSKHLEAFLKFSMILEKHLSDPKCVLAQIRRRFVEIMVRTYTESTVGRISELVDSVNQFLKIMAEAVIDYYNLNSFIEGEASHNPFIANEDNILSVTTAILFKDKPFYDLIYNSAAMFNQEREAAFQKILRLLEKEPPATFYIREKFCLDRKTIEASLPQGREFSIEGFVLNDEPYGQCKMMLNELETARSPIGKMKAIYGCSEMMNRQIERFYDVNGLEREKWVLDADQVLSIFCYIIVGARLPHLHTHLFLLDNFATSSQMISIFGYYLSVMNCAVEQLQNDYSEHAQQHPSPPL